MSFGFEILAIKKKDIFLCDTVDFGFRIGVRRLKELGRTKEREEAIRIRKEFKKYKFSCSLEELKQYHGPKADGVTLIIRNKFIPLHEYLTVN